MPVTRDGAETQATGKNPFDAPGTAWPPVGAGGGETKNVAHEPRADTGNVNHGEGEDPFGLGLDVAMSTAEIKGWKKP
jgi:hypothetical protein